MIANKKKRKTTIFSTEDYWSEESWQNALKNLQLNSEEKRKNFSDNEIREEMNFLADMEWKDVYSELLKYFGEQKIVVIASIGRWNGTFAGGNVGEFEELFGKMIDKQDDFEIYDEAGHFFVTTYHHDGRNYFEIKILTNTGKRAYENFYYGELTSKFSDYSERKLHELFMKNNFYAKLPRFAEKVYGVK